jgi:hypothetical protein
MEAVLYMTTRMLDRHDEDIMLETAICKVFCSEMGWRAVNDAMQIMGGESYMTENEVERIFRDSRINLIVEGANEVMQSFIFAYGGKQLAERMLGIQEAVGWNEKEGLGGNIARILRNGTRARVMQAALPLALELFLGVRRKAPVLSKVHPSLREEADRLCRFIREHSHQFKQASKRYKEAIINRQAVQARVADSGLWLHAWACTLSRLDLDVRKGGEGAEFERDTAAARHFFDLAEESIRENFRKLYENTDDTMAAAAGAALKYTETLPNELFSIPEKSPVAAGTGRRLKQDGIKQFPGDKHVPAGAAANGHG